MKGLTNNQLKMIALIAMTLDHIGVVMFPRVAWLRIVGRLAYPLFAYMIAEGCRHTRSMGRYFATMAILALGCQVVNYVTQQQSLYQSILVTFTLSIGIIWLLKTAEKKKSPVWLLLGVTGIAGAYFVCEILPDMLRGTNFCIDYDFIGVMVPVLVYLGKDKYQRLIILLLGLVALSASLVKIQWYCLLAVPLLLLYNGQRGKWKMKWLFYIYYPLHLAAIYGISMVL